MHIIYARIQVFPQQFIRWHNLIAFHWEKQYQLLPIAFSKRTIFMFSIRSWTIFYELCNTFDICKMVLFFYTSKNVMHWSVWYHFEWGKFICNNSLEIQHKIKIYTNGNGKIVQRSAKSSHLIWNKSILHVFAFLNNAHCTIFMCEKFHLLNIELKRMKKKNESFEFYNLKIQINMI